MDWLELLYKIFEVCIIPLLGILTVYAVKFINTKALEIKSNNDNAILKKYVDMLSQTITECVIATNQTYVEALKKQGSFDKKAQKQAFKLTYEAVMKILNNDAKEYLTNVFGDLEIYITNQIEAKVNANKE